ncbi:hypothetical protein IFM89_024274 [Coptis chinensis]|uniref:RWP-RK domain-containing protein n=1 Tax=Coptis chinensis TaxID=261450 RepID=A0A835HJL5_9MAGN|nr:hypothetical protein IFM89_024274 [Coptis chinensis]
MSLTVVDNGLSGSFPDKKITYTAASPEHVASISFDDISKYFGRPVREACANLKVGQTVLKRKCRDFGIPKWPYRKIKSLDNLIHNIKAEVGRQQAKMNQETAEAVLETQKIIESEKELIEKRPAIQLKSETKKFRERLFKRKHLAQRAQERTSEAKKRRTNITFQPEEQEEVNN